MTGPNKESTPSAFRDVPRTGVIYVTTEAMRRGFSTNAADWCNLGQGQPETGPLPGASPRITQLTVDVDDLEYAPPAGLWELREQVASYYNQRFRRGMSSRYTAEHVCIGAGGRALLTRAAASLGSVNLGHFLPDYTAYEELLDIFKAFTAIPILREDELDYRITPTELAREIRGRGLGALLVSNPCNPTGTLLRDEELAGWCKVAKRLDCALLIDEFYSHYVYHRPPNEAAIVSAAAYVDDVDTDPVLIFDGLTKNWRYPGWRVSWALGPKPVIQALASAGSFLDGGGAKPLQRAAIPLLEQATAAAETLALQQCFRAKRDWLVPRLESLGIRCGHPPEGTFYIWGSVAQLPPPWNDGMGFFRAALEEKVITVPGEFFDVNPGRRRRQTDSRFRQHLRFSFGPSQATLERAMDRLAKRLTT